MKELYKASHVTAAILNFNGKSMLGSCIESILNLNNPPAEIIMVDDGSTDGSPQWVKEHFPDVRVIDIGYNSKRLNHVRNRALRESETELAILIDNDVALQPDCLEQLLKGLNELPDAAVCMPRALYDNERDSIYQDGQILHYVAATIAINRGKPIAQADLKPRISIGWGVQLINRKKASEIGNFNEKYVMGWGDDGEFNHRMNLTGRLCYHIPSAIVFHKRVSGAKRYYGTVRNRLRFLLETYSLKSLVLCFPALFTYEMALFLFLLSKGSAFEYLKGLFYFGRNILDILKVRKKIQALRINKDRYFMGSGEIFIYPEYTNSKLLKTGLSVLVNFLNTYWVMVYRWM